VPFVPKNKFRIAMDFHLSLKVIFGVALGGLSVFALNGYGVWSLIVKCYRFSNNCYCIVVLRKVETISVFKKVFPKLFGYGSNLLVASLYTQTLNNIYNICIGRYYPTTALGYYTRAKTNIC
jgi:O-antigen/teichoic acid export membrane protein